MKVVLAFSGGLDTSFCVPWLREEKGAEVITVTVDTGGATREDLASIRRQAEAVGAADHREIDARASVYEAFVATLIRGNVLRGGVYPLSVAAERTQQAIEVARVAREIGADAVAHGSTGAGNDQVRFDVALRVLVPGLPILTPIRELELSREKSTAYLEERGLPVPEGSGRYSVNRGLWGTTLGGAWTHASWTPPPEDAYGSPLRALEAESDEVVIRFERGLPVALDEEALPGHELVEALGARTRALGIGRGIHVGETALGIKGRIGFEAGAAIVLIHAHRELEKLVLTRWQAFWKDHLASFFGDRLHEGQAFDPVMQDIRALIDSSQRRVDGEARVALDRGGFRVVGVRSPHSLMDDDVARYGETHALWTGDEARAFSKIASIPALMVARREAGEDS
jgi:argininosuccinate synthase